MYPTLLLVLVVCFVYAVISPFIMPAGGVFFAFAYLVYKHQVRASLRLRYDLRQLLLWLRWRTDSSASPIYTRLAKLGTLYKFVDLSVWRVLILFELFQFGHSKYNCMY